MFLREFRYCLGKFWETKNASESNIWLLRMNHFSTSITKFVRFLLSKFFTALQLLNYKGIPQIARQNLITSFSVSWPFVLRWSRLPSGRFGRISQSRSRVQKSTLFFHQQKVTTNIEYFPKFQLPNCFPTIRNPCSKIEYNATSTILNTPPSCVTSLSSTLLWNKDGCRRTVSPRAKTCSRGGKGVWKIAQWW